MRRLLLRHRPRLSRKRPSLLRARRRLRCPPIRRRLQPLRPRPPLLRSRQLLKLPRPSEQLLQVRLALGRALYRLPRRTRRRRPQLSVPQLNPLSPRRLKRGRSHHQDQASRRKLRGRRQSPAPRLRQTPRRLVRPSDRRERSRRRSVRPTPRWYVLRRSRVRWGFRPSILRCFLTTTRARSHRGLPRA